MTGERWTEADVPGRPGWGVLVTGPGPEAVQVFAARGATAVIARRGTGRAGRVRADAAPRARRWAGSERPTGTVYEP